MKFLFVHSWQGFSLAEWYIREAVTNACKADVEFRSVDIPPAGIPANDNLQRILFLWEPDIVGFSCHYWSIQSFISASKWIKEARPATTIVFGGPQVNSVNAAASLLENNETVDFVVRGSGEESLCLLLESIADKISVEKVPGLSFREQGRIVHINKAISRRKRNLIFHKGNSELEACIEKYDEISYETTSGCHSKCSYCYYPTEKLRILDDERVLAELSYICGRNIRNLRFCDTHFGGTADRAKKILRHLKKINKNTCLRIYPDPGHIDNEYLQLIRESGAQVTSIGIQTTNRKSLEKIQREPVTRYIKNIAMILKEFPEVPADLIMGLPGDDIRGIEQSFKDVLKLGFNTVNIFRLMVFPGTGLSENLAENYATDRLLVSDQGQFVFAEGFPAVDQKKVSALIISLEIICWLVRTGTMKLSPTMRIRKFSKLQTSLDPSRLLDLYQMIRQGYTYENEEKIIKTGLIIKKVFEENNI